MLGRKHVFTSCLIAALGVGYGCSGDAAPPNNDTGAGGEAASSSGDQSGSGNGTGGGFGGNFSSSSAGGNSGDSGCKKVDFLFIIDNSVSMSDQQAALIASFPGFIDAIENTVEASDYHIMVADTDDETRCTPDNCNTGNMGAQDLCIDAANGYACNTNLFDTCDNTIGAGVVHPAGDGATNAPCTIFGGNRYIIDGEPDLVDTFSCMALVGLAGHPSERPMDSLVAAMSEQMNAAGACNEGFLRDDAILVVTFISDDPNYEDQDGPQEWYDAVVAAKGGNPDAVVVLGLTPNFDGCQDGKGPPKGSHWSEFVAMWGARGLEASVCNLDYAPFFEQAVSVIDTTCDEFEPPQ
jgi:hypothetical protein